MGSVAFVLLVSLVACRTQSDDVVCSSAEALGEVFSVEPVDIERMQIQHRIMSDEVATGDLSPDIEEAAERYVGLVAVALDIYRDPDSGRERELEVTEKSSEALHDLLDVCRT